MTAGKALATAVPDVQIKTPGRPVVGRNRAKFSGRTIYPRSSAMIITRNVS